MDRPSLMLTLCCFLHCISNLLFQEQKKKGVIAASAGNHALALSYHGQQLGIPVTVVMPTNAPINKVASCRKYGANVHVQGSDLIDVSDCFKWLIILFTDYYDRYTLIIIWLVIIFMYKIYGHQNSSKVCYQLSSIH